MHLILMAIFGLQVLIIVIVVVIFWDEQFVLLEKGSEFLTDLNSEVTELEDTFVLYKFYQIW